MKLIQRYSRRLTFVKWTFGMLSINRQPFLFSLVLLDDKKFPKQSEQDKIEIKNILITHQGLTT